MTATLLAGGDVAKRIQSQIKQQLQSHMLRPQLAVLLVGDNPASDLYVKRKEQACLEVGMRSRIVRLPDTISTSTLLEALNQFNQDPDVHGILVQLPLPAQINPHEIIAAIDPQKDVDGFHPLNLGRLAGDQGGLHPCTPKGIMTLLQHYALPMSGKHAVVVGASNIVGRPMALELLNAGATVTICHRKTVHLSNHTRRADILISATGQVHLIQADMVQEGAIVIDVGIHRLDDGRIVGDVNFDAVKEPAAYITPVPGGVGPMTIATLLENTLLAYMMQSAYD